MTPTLGATVKPWQLLAAVLALGAVAYVIWLLVAFRQGRRGR
jgi:hypothetical protein